MSATENTEVTTTQLTVAEYVALGGVRCPKCGSEDIQGGSFNHEDGEVSQGVGCLVCGAEWVDVYVLDRYFE